MLEKMTFAAGVSTINATLNKQNKVESPSELSLIYAQLTDLPNHLFLEGVKLLLQNENLYVFPSIYKIRTYVNKVAMFGYSEQEIFDLAKVRKESGIPYSNPNIEYLIQHVDINKSSPDKLTFLPNIAEQNNTKNNQRYLNERNS